MIFFLYLNLSEHLKGTEFGYDEKIKAEAERWFAAENEQFFMDGITKRVKRWQKCIIVLEGSFVEK